MNAPVKSSPQPCLVCGAIPEPATPADVAAHFGTDGHPYAATVFTTRGHYGSTVFDPGDDRHQLQVTICDACLDERKDRVLARDVIRHSHPVYSTRPWEGPDEDWPGIVLENDPDPSPILLAARHRRDAAKGEPS